ncbi:CO dehydrogenase/acetyl-CoA synthase complex, epsilon subunit [Methanocaldococcus infernus ME]|uniref:CO dehydrogenase/acetyl-CoA synthase complex, epsilon subunit n=1 Tax=Methanocaldococcus infernus (strain DSM 11812 / JCM 15783 / ME) TaxID=573063 RepID=D5VSY6_METIM|nr:CO dehydrogenase/acetyl-CoA synthase complex subunit epsilon [Methanocaldococcus infernus]ADG13689.1 CO dehydrogenase/acetyl-CoA synthase complex, epsilon subunit [Methanocaldococcus infernus ME]
MWNPAYVTPEIANIASPKIVAMAVKKAKRPMFVLGSLLNSLPEEITMEILEVAKLLKNKYNVTIVSTGGSYLTLSKYLEPDAKIGIIDLINNLRNPYWEGFDGKGNYDLILFVGVPYYIATQGLSTLKHFAPHLRTITLCKFMHPNADYSFPNLSNEDWLSYLRNLKSLI